MEFSLETCILFENLHTIAICLKRSSAHHENHWFPYDFLVFCVPCGGLRKAWNTDESLRELTFRVGFLFRSVDLLRNLPGVINQSWNPLPKHESSSEIFIRLQFSWKNRPRITENKDFLMISLCFACPVGGCEKQGIPMISLGESRSALHSSSDSWFLFENHQGLIDRSRNSFPKQGTSSEFSIRL